MTIHVHDCDGCAPQPLANYLKALGILRLVAEQKDPQARGWWDGDRFRLATTLDREGLRKFFLDDYRPTPLIAPWNKGSGFYKADDPALTPIAVSSAPRLAPYAKAIAVARGLLDRIAEADALIRSIKARTKTNKSFQSEKQRDDLQGSQLFQRMKVDLTSELERAQAGQDPDKVQLASTTLRELAALVEPATALPSAKQAKALKESDGFKRLLAAADRNFKQLKADLIPACRRVWRGGSLEWMDCAMVVDANGEAACPALLGTGGNDGNLDFTNKFMDRIGVVFDLSDVTAKPGRNAIDWIDHAVFGATTKGLVTGKDGKIGQFLPGGAGGANLTAGFGGQDETLLNPFDYLLMMEGTLVFAAALAKRDDAHGRSRAAAPFAVGSHAAGYASAGSSDEGFRGEQWMPLWSSPITGLEIRHLFAEGRAQLGPQSAKEPLDLARAVAGLGVARGITGFERYGYIERNGQSNLAVPLGRFSVPNAVAPGLSCIDDLQGWLARLRRQVRDDHAPVRLKQVERNLSDSLFAVVQHPGEASRWQTVLVALAGVELVMASGSGFAAGPVPPLRPDWAVVADDGSPTFRLALSCALQVGDFRRDGRPVDGIRRHALPMKGSRFNTRSEGLRQRLLSDPGVVMAGRDGTADAIALVARRLVESAQAGGRRLPLQAMPRTGARLDDLAALLAGEVDLDRVLVLARGLMAINPQTWAEQPPVLRPMLVNKAMPDDAWMAIRLALLPWPLPKPDGRRIGTDPAIVRRLAAGDAKTAIDLALRRLRAAGITATIRSGSTDPASARRWAAALAFPITPQTAERLVRHLNPHTSMETAHAR